MTRKRDMKNKKKTKKHSNNEYQDGAQTNSNGTWIVVRKWDLKHHENGISNTAFKPS